MICLNGCRLATQVGSIRGHVSYFTLRFSLDFTEKQDDHDIPIYHVLLNLKDNEQFRESKISNASITYKWEVRNQTNSID